MAEDIDEDEVDELSTVDGIFISSTTGLSLEDIFHIKFVTLFR